MDSSQNDWLLSDEKAPSIRIGTQTTSVEQHEDQLPSFRRRNGILEEVDTRLEKGFRGVSPRVVSWAAYSAVIVLFGWAIFHIWCVNDLSSVFYAMFFSSSAVAPGVHLRVLPLGDSITMGIGSSDGNGYRKMLEEHLIQSGSSVEFIGNLTSGEHDQYRHEGWGGRRIHEITTNAFRDGAFREHPNVVLLHAGTNDLQMISTSEKYDSAPARLGNLIDGILCECPDAVILVAQIVWHEAGDIIPRLEAYNFAMRDVVDRRTAKGYRVELIDQSLIGPADLWDGLHPNDVGYKKMALNWFHALQDLPPAWFTAPREPAAEYNDRTCSLDEAFWGRQNDHGRPDRSAVKAKVHMARDEEVP